MCFAKPVAHLCPSCNRLGKLESRLYSGTEARDPGKTGIVAILRHKVIEKIYIKL